MRVSASIKPSNTFESSMNFFQPQSCSFFQNRCKVSVQIFFIPQVMLSCNEKNLKSNVKKPTRIFWFLWILIHHCYCKLCKMTPTYFAKKGYRSWLIKLKTRVVHNKYNSNRIVPGRSLSWFATQRKRERWLQTSQPWG